MKISTATSVFVNYAIDDTLDEIIQAGFDGIDIWCGRPHLYRQDYPRERMQSLHRRLTESGVSPVSFMPAFFRYPYSLSSPNPAIRADSISYMKDTIDNACFFEANHVLVVPTRRLEGQSSADARGWFVDSLAQVGAYAETCRMKLGIEIVYPALSDYMHSSQDALGVIAEIGSPNLGIVLDSGHLNLSGEDLEGAIRAAGPLLVQMHVNDNDAVHQQNAVPGEGNVDFTRLLRLLGKYGYAGFLTLEIGWQYSFDPVPAVRRSLAGLRELLGRGEGME